MAASQGRRMGVAEGTASEHPSGQKTAAPNPTLDCELVQQQLPEPSTKPHPRRPLVYSPNRPLHSDLIWLTAGDMMFRQSTPALY